VKKYTQLTKKDRDTLYLLRRKGLSGNKISLKMGRSRSTISRELCKNSVRGAIGYLPDKAHQMARDRKSVHRKKIVKNRSLMGFIISHLQKKWSPLIISGRMKQQELPFYASPETIYQFIYSDKDKELFWFLPQQRKKRGFIAGRKHRKSNIAERVSIHERPEDVSNRSEFGHFEADLIFHKGSQSTNIAVLVERKTRYAIMIKNESKESLPIIMSFYRKLLKMPGLPVKSVTFDNGSEFAWHFLLKRGLGIKTFFCDAYSAWQKGQVERTNKTIRRFLDKTRPLEEISDDELSRVQDAINSMPRRILGFRSPLEVYRDISCCTSI
jgi:transposase, IS30 family